MWLWSRYAGACTVYPGWQAWLDSRGRYYAGTYFLSIMLCRLAIQLYSLLCVPVITTDVQPFFNVYTRSCLKPIAWATAHGRNCRRLLDCDPSFGLTTFSRCLIMFGVYTRRLHACPKPLPRLPMSSLYQAGLCVHCITISPA